MSSMLLWRMPCQRHCNNLSKQQLNEEHASSMSEGRKRKEASIRQTTFNRDVTEVTKDLDNVERATVRKR